MANDKCQMIYDKLKCFLAGAALTSPSRVESAACCTTNIHRSREPTGDERTNAQNPDQDGSVQKKIFQTYGFSTPLER